MALSEFALIDRYFRNDATALQRPELVLGIGDDAALLAPKPNHELVLAVDTLVAGVHFPTDMAATQIGYRSLAVNLSDLAAMGAEPACFTLALTLPAADAEWLEGFSRGLFALAVPNSMPLVGGDTTRGPLTITVQVMGYVPCGEALRRDNAQPGDLIYVSGHPGDAAAGLALLADLEERTASLRQRFLRPQPRLQLGQALRSLAHACIDISDGLVADVGHIAARSQLGAAIDLGLLPLSQALQAQFDLPAAQRLALYGGDDYELCFCVAAAHRQRLHRLAQQLAVPLTCIGRMEQGAGVTLYGAEGVPLEREGHDGYQHF